METVTVEEYKRLLQKTSSKHGNERTAIDGYAFDSKAEAERYKELRLLAEGGVISGLRVHPLYTLQAAFEDAAGVKHRAISYEGDFGYIEKGVEVVEDVKGHRTEIFKLKFKLFRYRFPDIVFRIIKV